MAAAPSWRVGLTSPEPCDRDKFRPWVVDFAVPAAWADREPHAWEQDALRGYDMRRVRGWREAARGGPAGA